MGRRRRRQQRRTRTYRRCRIVSAAGARYAPTLTAAETVQVSGQLSGHFVV